MLKDYNLFRITREKSSNMLNQRDPIQLSLQEKRMLNVLQMKTYDISENIEILARQLSTSQIKDVVAKSYSVFCQLKKIFDKMGVDFLYQIIKKMQINSVFICSILTQNLQKRLGNENEQKKQVDPRKQKSVTQQSVNQSRPVEQQINVIKIPRLGGINLYNQSYHRGLEYSELTGLINMQQASDKYPIRQSKQMKNEFLNSVAQQLQNKTDVQIQNINDEIKNYMRYYKEQNSKIGSYVSYQSQISQIIDFFKVSQLEAMKFINKQSKTTYDIPDDYLHRLNDMEKDIRTKEDKQKAQLLQKVKILIVKLKDKLLQNQRIYEEKNAKLMAFKKSLQRQMVDSSAQTYDGYDRKMKQLQSMIRQNQDKYKILTDLRRKEYNSEDKIYELNHQLQMRQNQLTKSMISNQQKQYQLQYLKKIIRDNKEKLNLSELDRKNLKSNSTKKQILLNKNMDKDNKNGEEKTSSPDSQNQWVPGKPRKTRRYEKYGTKYNSNGLRPNLNVGEEGYNEETSCYEVREQEERDSIILDDQNNKNQQIIKRDSSFKQQLPKYNEQQKQKQVSFEIGQYKSQTQSPSQKSKMSSQHKDILTIYKSAQKSQSSISIDQNNLDGQKDQLEDDFTRKSARKNTLKQKIDLSVANKQLQHSYTKVSTVITSKKCIILKQTKQKNMITTSMKILNLSISQQVNLIFQNQLSQLPISPYGTAYMTPQIQKVARYQRSSYPMLKKNYKDQMEAQKQLDIDDKFSSVKKINYLYQQIKNKSIGNQSSHILSNGGMRREASAQQPNIGAYNSKYSSHQYENILKRQIRQNQEKPKRQIPSLSTMLSKKSKKQLNKFRQKFQDKGISLNDKGMSLAQLGKSSSLIKKINLPSDKWQSLANSKRQQDITIVNYIQSQLQQQNLNAKEFEQILKIMDEEDECQQQIHLNKQPKIYKNGNTLGIIKQFQKIPHNIQNKINKAQPQPGINSKQPLNIMPLEKIKNIHLKFSNCCHNKQNTFCHHIQKYLQIIIKINEIKGNTKLPMKLPVQKIGQPFEQKEILMNDRLAINKPKLIKRGQQVCSNQSFEQNSQIYQLNADFSHQRQRILPIINNTTQYKYKGKNKIIK